jgi:hypothetical protein
MIISFSVRENRYGFKLGADYANVNVGYDTYYGFQGFHRFLSRILWVITDLL